MGPPAKKRRKDEERSRSYKAAQRAHDEYLKASKKVHDEYAKASNDTPPRRNEEAAHRAHDDYVKASKKAHDEYVKAPGYYVLVKFTTSPWQW